MFTCSLPLVTSLRFISKVSYFGSANGDGNPVHAVQGQCFQAAFFCVVSKKNWMEMIWGDMFSDVLKGFYLSLNWIIQLQDHANRKSNQQNLGTIHCSNLCSEIIEYTSPDEVAVCNLALQLQVVVCWWMLILIIDFVKGCLCFSLWFAFVVRRTLLNQRRHRYCSRWFRRNI